MIAKRLGAGKPGFTALLARVKKVVQGALANADVPFQQVVSDAGVPRSSAYSPVFQTMFMLDDASFSAETPQGKDAEGNDSIEVRGQHAARCLPLIHCRPYARPQTLKLPVACGPRRPGQPRSST